VRPLIVVLGITALLAAGCGGGSSSSSSTSGGGPATTAARTTTASVPPLSKAAYQAKLKQIAADIRNRLGPTVSSGKIPKSDVDALVDAFHAFADRLAELNPPAAVKPLHAQLIKAMDDLGDEFPGLAARLNKSSKDPTALISAFFGAHAIQELAKIGQQLKAKGYQLDLNP
jgi:hypothetical protein